MERLVERRTEQRLRYHWPIWFAEDFEDVLSQGQMIDLSSGGAAFTCTADERCPYPGQSVTARFSVPRFGPDESFNMTNFVRSGHICRIERVNNFICRAAMQFAEPLPFKPGEQTEAESEAEKALATAVI